MKRFPFSFTVQRCPLADEALSVIAPVVPSEFATDTAVNPSDVPAKTACDARSAFPRRASPAALRSIPDALCAIEAAEPESGVPAKAETAIEERAAIEIRSRLKWGGGNGTVS